MSLLSTFSILFETDADEAASEVEALAEGLDGVADSADPAAAGLDDVTIAADSNAASVSDLTGMIIKMGAAYVGFNAIATGVIDNALSIDVIGKFSQVLGQNIVEVDAWGEAVARSGGSAESFRGSFESLTSSLTDIEITGGGDAINTLAMLGISATDAGGRAKSAFDI